MGICLASALVVAVFFDVADALTQEARQTALDEHNDRRSQLALGKEPAKGGGFLPSAKNMYKLAYSEELESIAQEWANGCDFSHSPSSHRPNAGENIYMSSANQKPSDAIRDAAKLFWDENVEKGVPKNDLRLTDALFSRGVGHFTQMAWAATTELGCGVKWCPNTPMTFVVCNYRISGNWIGEQIYEPGNACKTAGDCSTYPDSACDAGQGLCLLPAAKSGTPSTNVVEPNSIGSEPTDETSFGGDEGNGMEESEEPANELLINNVAPLSPVQWWTSQTNGNQPKSSSSWSSGWWPWGRSSAYNQPRGHHQAHFRGNYGSHFNSYGVPSY